MDIQVEPTEGQVNRGCPGGDAHGFGKPEKNKAGYFLGGVRGPRGSG